MCCSRPPSPLAHLPVVSGAPVMSWPRHLSMLLVCVAFLVQSYTAHTAFTSSLFPLSQDLLNDTHAHARTHARNGLDEDDDDEDSCAGCMSQRATVVLRRMCEGAETRPDQQSCGRCLCMRPMWCASCVAKWFASKQVQSHPEAWLAGKAPCPTCRAVFCVFDVCEVSPPS